ncbi:hypothetical protein [Burkholderia pseudomallei]|uniref:hypothetical protein n=1 Tax=Burkholderia pseudomallei TaxID=28450 RepID=UPI0013E9B558|nr:hypothetical protein [Burkholderia pseudomallei]
MMKPPRRMLNVLRHRARQAELTWISGARGAFRRECGVNAVSTKHVRRAESGCLRVEKRATKRVTKRGVAGRPRRAGAQARGRARRGATQMKRARPA